MTSLQKQLASLHAASSNELDLRAQKNAHSKSLLFEPRVAATQSFDDIFQLCFEGFEDLCDLDPKFIQYERSLFSPYSKNQDRQQMTTQENKEVDAVIEDFLGLAGARLLLKPTQKALEWLIRRFRIHEFNVETLLMTCLPYHATPLFLSVLSILPAKLPPSLKFLHANISTVSNPSRQVFVRSAMQNSSFFAALNRYILSVSRANHSYSALISTWASIMAQCIDGSLNESASGRKEIHEQKQEDLLIKILPVVNEIFQLKAAPELTMACYMIITVLLGKARLEERVLDALMISVVLNWTSAIHDPGVACLALIAEQKQSVSLPKPVFRAVCKTEELYQRLQRLSHGQNIERLTLGIIDSIITLVGKQYIPEATSFLETTLRHGPLTASQRKAAKHSLRSAINSAKSNPYSSDHRCRMQVEELSSILEVPAPRTGSTRTKGGTHKKGTVEENISEESDQSDSALSISQSLPPAELSNATAELDLNPLKDMDSHPGRSFLTAGSIADFLSLMMAFERAGASPSTLGQLLDLPVFQKELRVTSPTFFSFLARVWCVSGSIAARCSALTVTSKAINDCERGSCDFQGLVPYALAGMTDPSQKVRRCAADLVFVLDQLCGDNNSKLEMKSSHTKWGDQKIYPDSNIRLEWLSRKDANAFSTILVSALEECVTDRSHVGALIKNIFLGTTSSSGQMMTLKGNKLKSAQRTNIFAMLASHVNATGCPTMKLRLLRLLTAVDKVGSQPRSTFLLPSLSDYASQPPAFLEACRSEGIDLSVLEKQLLAVLHPKDENALSCLLSVVTGGMHNSNSTLRTRAFQRISSLWPHLEPHVQNQLAKSLLEAALDVESDEISRKGSTHILKTAQLSSDALLTFIEDAMGTFDQEQGLKGAKRRRTSFGSAASDDREQFKKHSLIKVTLVLEACENSKPAPSTELLHALFRVLQALQNYRTMMDSDLGYVVNLALNSIHSTLQQILRDPSAKKLNVSVVRADLLVDCVQTSASSQTRNTAFLILSGLCKYAPQTVLQSVMPIFTMMSATIARNSDEFSAHVVDQTIREVVPKLAERLHEQNKDLVSATAEVLLSFSAAFEHIPSYRRTQLFALLASSLGAREALFAIIATLVDLFPDNTDVSRFVPNLLSQFDSVVCLASIRKYLQLILAGLDDQPSLFQTLITRDSSDDYRDRNLKNLLRVASFILDDQKLSEKLNNDLSSPSDIVTTLQEEFCLSIEQLIKISQCADGDIRAAASKILEKLLTLFPFTITVDSAKPLVNHSDPDVCRSVLRALAKQMDSANLVDGPSKAAAVGLLESILPVLNSSDDRALKLSALACVDHICKKFGRVEPSAISTAMLVISSECCLGSEDIRLRTFSVQCLTSGIEVLQNDFIPLLQRAEPTVLSSLDLSISAGPKEERLHNAIFAFLAALANHLPFILSKSSLRRIFISAQESATADLGEEARVHRVEFMQLASKKVEMATVTQVLENVWSIAIDNGPQALGELVQTFKTMVETQPKSLVIQHSRALNSAFLQAFNIRKEALEEPALYSSKTVELLEDSIIDGFITMVMKINDTVFRPFLLRLVDWSSELSDTDFTGKVSRLTCLFKLATALSERLKVTHSYSTTILCHLKLTDLRSIFTTYFQYLLDPAREALKQNLSVSASGKAARSAIMRALTSSFQQDKDEFWQAPERFNTVLDLLIFQLAGSTGPLHSREIVSAVTELAAAAASNEHYKEMNTALLKLLRSDDRGTRLVAVKCQQSLAERLGDEWLGNLPEMLPFINELQEDDDEHVEKETHRWIKLIEDTLGESLNSMLQ